jgi:predicted ArsR family transcriptional regulator
LLLLSASNQRLLVPAIWAAIAEICGAELKWKVLRRVGRKMADHYKPRIAGKTARERLVEFAEVLREEGCLVEVEETGNGQMVLHKRSCPFISMFEDSRSVCYVDRELLRLIVRAPVRQTHCRHDGDPCCCFAVRLKRK